MADSSSILSLFFLILIFFKPPDDLVLFPELELASHVLFMKLILDGQHRGG